MVQEIKPRWVVGENVANFVGMELNRTLSDLESEGYETQTFIIPALAVGTPHKRDRVFVIAHSDGKRRNGLAENIENGLPEINLQGHKQGGYGEAYLPSDIHGILNNPMRGILRKDDGLSEGMDRLKSLGNAVVPQQAYPIFQAIADIEKGAIA